MDFIIKVLVNALVIFFLSNQMSSIKVRSYGSAIWVFLLIGLLNASIGFLLRLPMNLLTLFLLCFIVRLIVSAIMIKLASKLYSGFEVKNWTAAFLLAVALAITSYFLDKIL